MIFLWEGIWYFSKNKTCFIFLCFWDIYAVLEIYKIQKYRMTSEMTCHSMLYWLITNVFSLLPECTMHRYISDLFWWYVHTWLSSSQWNISRPALQKLLIQHLYVSSVKWSDNPRYSLWGHWNLGFPNDCMPCSWQMSHLLIFIYIHC
jgi:hypothetical protein